MTKSLYLLAVLTLFAGCSSQPEVSTINVYVDRDGHLSTQGFTLEPADMPAFAKQVGNDNVVLTPIGGNSVSPDFGKAVEAQNELKAAGVKNVTIGVKSGT